ncbi:MAG: dUTP diphosphatase [Candidatus Moraniibacteriota bacterium]
MIFIHMDINVKRFSAELPLPKYEKGAAGFDLFCGINASIGPNEIRAIPANIAMSVPRGYVLLIIPRSSTPTRKGLVMPHSMGVVDPYFCSEESEIKLIFQNITNKAVKIRKGDKLAQGIIVKCEMATFNEVDKFKKTRRKVCTYQGHNVSKNNP